MTVEQLKKICGKYRRSNDASWFQVSWFHLDKTEFDKGITDSVEVRHFHNQSMQTVDSNLINYSNAYHTASEETVFTCVKEWKRQGYLFIPKYSNSNTVELHKWLTV